MEIKEKYLPIGTVAMLENGEKRIMIIGYCVINSEDKKMYDYSGVIFPEGAMDYSHTLMFNHDQIKEIYHYGLEDDEQKQFNKDLKEIIANQENIDNQE